MMWERSLRKSGRPKNRPIWCTTELGLTERKSLQRTIACGKTPDRGGGRGICGGDKELERGRSGRESS